MGLSFHIMKLGDKKETRFRPRRVLVFRSGCYGYSDVVDKIEEQINHLPHVYKTTSHRCVYVSGNRKII